MRKSVFNKVLSLLLALALSVSVAGCSTSSKSPNLTASGSSAKVTTAKTKVVFWYLWGGDEGNIVKAAVNAYNKQCSKYEVEGLSAPDNQKVMTAISAGNGPDVSDEFSYDVGKLATAGVLEPLDNYITKANYDISDFIPTSVESCKMNGKTYAIPIGVTLVGLYYNKTMLKNAGYTEPPKTLEEMYDMAVKTTKVKSDGSLETFGFPDFPAGSYLGNFAVSAGGGWYTKDGKPSAADNSGNRFALKLARDYRTKFGITNVVKFQSGGKYMDPNDPFLAGKQTFRVDGPWLGKSIKEISKSNIDYGVTYIPYPKDNPELEGRGTISSSMLYIPSNSKNKDGAWDFLSWYAGKDGQVQTTIGMGNLPSRTSLWNNSTFLKGYDVDFYTKLSQSKNLVPTPNGPKNSEYETMLNAQTELCLDFKQDIDTTLKNIYQKGTELMK